jgi:hypothetical protein
MSFKIEVNNPFFFIKKFFMVNIIIPMENNRLINNKNITNETINNMTNETITNLTDNITSKLDLYRRVSINLI